MESSTSSYVPVVPKVVKSRLSGDFEPNDYTVMCGKGKEYYNNIGNRRFRVIVEMNLQRYTRTVSKAGKSDIVSEVIRVIRASGGQFAKLENSDEWWDIGDVAAREKVGSYFRDCLHVHYKSSTKAKTASRRKKRKQKRGCLDDDESSVTTEYTDYTEYSTMSLPVPKRSSFSTPDAAERRRCVSSCDDTDSFREELLSLSDTNRRRCFSSSDSNLSYAPDINLSGERLDLHFSASDSNLDLPERAPSLSEVMREPSLTDVLGDEAVCFLDTDELDKIEGLFDETYF
jgi:hypothetical protein